VVKLASLTPGVLNIFSVIDIIVLAIIQKKLENSFLFLNCSVIYADIGHFQDIAFYSSKCKQEQELLNQHKNG